MKYLKFKEILKNITAPVILYILVLIGFWAFALPFIEKNIMDSKKETIKELSHLSEHLIEHYYNRYRSGELSEDEAKKRVLARLEDIKYGPDNKDYFWILNTKKSVVMHPFNKDLVGKSVNEIKDTNKVRILKEMVNLCLEQGEGFIKYPWEWYGDTNKVVNKLSYIRLFEPWQWTTGTGMYINDAEKQIANITKYASNIFLLLGLIIFGLSVYISIMNVRNVSKLIETNYELNERTENLRITLNSIGDAVISTDTKGNIIRMNPVAEKLTGWKIDEAKYKNINDVFNIINAQTRIKADNPVEKVLNEGIIVGLANHTALISKTNEEYQIADSAAPIKNSNGDIEGVVLVFRDVTEEYEIREKINENEKQLKEAQKIAKIGSWQFDLKNNKVYGSEEAFRIYGVKEGKNLTIEDAQEVPLPEYREMLDKAMLDLIKGKKKYDVEFKLKRLNDGKVFYVHSIAEYNHEEKTITGTIQDITDRKIAEEKLYESERRFKKYIENSPTPVFVADKSGDHIEVNDAASDLLGYTKEELLSKNIFDLIPEKEHKKVFEEFNKLINTGYNQLETYFERKNGTEGIWLVKAVKLSEDRYISYVHDLTEIRMAQEEIRINQERLRTAVEGTFDGLWDLNLITDEAYISDRFSTMLGYQPGELEGSGDSWRKLLHPDDYESALKILNDYLEGKTEKYVSEFRMRTKEGSYRWIQGRGKVTRDESGKPVRITGFNTDITERVEAEIELKERNSFIQTILDNLPIGVALNRFDEGDAFYMNKKFEEIYGWNFDELKDIKTFFEKVYPDPEYRKKITERIMTDIQTQDPERMHWEDIEITTSDKSKKIVNAVNIPLLEQNTMVSTVIDMTKQKEAENKIKQNQQELEFQSTLLNQIDDIITSTDLEGNIVFVNQAALDMLELSKEELLNSNIFAFGDDKSIGATQAQILNHVLENDYWNGEVVNYSKSGEKFILNTRVWKVFDENNKPIALCSVSTDVTKKKEIETKLLESQKVASLGHYTLDIKKGKWENSKELDNIFEIDEDFERNINAWLEFLHPDFKDEMKTYFFENILEKNEIFDKEYKIITNKTKNEKWVHGIGSLKFDDNGNPIEMFGTIQDITDRKLIQEELKISEERLGMAIEGGDLGTWDWNVKTGHVVFNEKWAKMLEYELYELEPNVDTWKNTVHPEDWEDTLKELNLCLEGKKEFYESEHRLKTKTGKLIWVIDKGKVIVRDKEGNPLRMVGTHFEITRRKNAEEEIKLKNEHLELINTNVPNILWKTRIDENGKYTDTYISDMVDVLLGSPKGTINNNWDKFFDYILPKYYKSIYSTIESGLKNLGTFYSFDYEVKKYNGELAWFSSTGRAVIENNQINIYGSTIDITERKIAEKAIRENEEQLDAIFSNSLNAIVVADDNGNYIRVNKAASDLFGYSEEELLKMSVGDIRMPSDENTIDQYQLYLKKGSERGEFEFIDKTGEHKIADYHAVRVRKDFNISVLSDITEKKKLEEKLIDSEEKYRALYMNAPLSYQSLDADGKFLDVNPEWEKTMGFKKDEVVGTWFGDYLGEGYVNHFDKNFPLFKKQGFIHDVQFEMIKKSGDKILVEFEGCIGYDKKGDVRQTYCTFKDITIQKEYENNLIQSEKELSESQRIAGLGSWELDLNTKIMSLSKEHNYLIGEKPDEVEMDVFEYSHKYIVEEDVDIIIDRFNYALNNNDEDYVDNFEYRIKSKNNSGIKYLRVISRYKSKNEIKGVTQDITHQKLSEIELKQQSELRSLLIKISSEFINLPLDKIHYEIQESLKNMSLFVGADRGYIFDFDSKTNICSNIYEWCGEGISSEMNNLQDIPLAEEWINEFSKGKTYSITNVNDLPSGLNKDVLQSQNIKSLTAVPMMRDNECIGFVGFDSVKKYHSYSDNEKQILSVFAELLVNIKLREKIETDFLNAKKKIEESEELFRTTFEQAEVGMAQVTSYGKFLRVNRKFCDITGYEESEIMKLTINDLTYEDDNIKEGELFDRVYNGEIDSYTIEKRYIRKDGKIVWVNIFSSVVRDALGEIKYAVAAISDITERKQMEISIINAKEKAIENENQFRQLFENLEQGFAFHQVIYNETGKPVDYKYIKINKAYEKLTGKKAEELIGKTVKEVMPETEDYWIEKFGNVGKRGVSISYENYARELGRYYNVIAYSPKPDYFAVVFTDVTERKIYEQELIAAKEKAEESDRLKSSFLANMSHEIRTPMNGILGFATLLKEPQLSDEEQIEYLNIIEESGKRMLNLINDLINISKIESGQMETNFSVVEINKIINEQYNFFKPEANLKSLDLSFSKGLSDKDSIIKTDKEKIFAILTNLIKNAIKYTNTGNIQFGYELKNNQLEFYIKDSGIGISKDKLEGIFDRFVQADTSLAKPYEGAGLGLSIAQAYVKMIGGRIWVESEINKGSVFYFTIPYNSATGTKNEAKKISEEEYISEDKISILIAEDDKSSLVLIQRLLKDIADEIISVNNGKEAVEEMKNNPNIDMVLMDIKMPVMDGYEATKKIREFNENVIIFAQTAYALEGDREKAIQAGCNDYITKPISRKVLFDAIKKFVQ